MTYIGSLSTDEQLKLDVEYSKQRKQRLGDVLLDYLDHEISPRKLYEELISETDDMINYHKDKQEKYEQFRELILGNRPVDLDS
tara:strand:+ start:2716 stop:2967 length:252 start_codon:yes stop_codon:yes gene_type:complete